MATSAALQARVHKLLGSQTELEATKTLLHTLVKDGTIGSASFVQPTPPTLATLRRHLRSRLETQQLALAQTALDGLERTLDQVTDLGRKVALLDYKCAEVHKFVDWTQKETEQVQTEAADLAKKRF